MAQVEAKLDKHWDIIVKCVFSLTMMGTPRPTFLACFIRLINYISLNMIPIFAHDGDIGSLNRSWVIDVNI